MIDNTVLFFYIERLPEEHKRALVDALSSTNRSGLEYKGPPLPTGMPVSTDMAGIPKLRPSHFVAGCYLSPLGAQMARLIRDMAEDTDTL